MSHPPRRRWAFPASFLFALALVATASAQESPSTKPAGAKDNPALFFPVASAKDCVFDRPRARLYVTTPTQLIVIDTKAKKQLEAIDLPGNLQGIDIAADASFVAIAPASAQFVYKVDTKWQQQDDMEISQIKFNAPAAETGVHSLAVGADNSILFGMTFAGSGWVGLRRIDAKTNGVEYLRRIRHNSIVAASPDRNFAAIAEGDISSGPLLVHEFATKTTKPVKELGGFNYEIACARNASHFARPTKAGCQIFDEQGGGLGDLSGKTVIAAAFHPKDDRLFVMRQGELSIQEYDSRGRLISGGYALDTPLVVKADVNTQVVGNLIPIGRDTVLAQFRRVVNVIHHTYASGRLRVSDDGAHLFAALPNGVYMFPVIPRPADSPAAPSKGPKLKVIDGSNVPGPKLKVIDGSNVPEPKLKVIDGSNVPGSNIESHRIEGFGELRFAKIDLQTKSLLGCARWADVEGTHAYLVDGKKGEIIKAEFPSGKVVSRKNLAYSIGWLDQSAEGWLVSVPDRDEVILLDSELEKIKTFSVPKLQLAASSPKLSIAVVSTMASKNSAGMLDLKTGEIQLVTGLQKFGGLGWPAVSPDGRYAFLTNLSGFTRFEVKGNVMTPIDTFKAGSNFRAVTISPDSKLVCQSAGGGNPDLGGSYRTAVMAIDNLKREFVLDFGAYPGAIGFDPAGGYVYASAHERHLVVANATGQRLFDYQFRNRVQGGFTVANLKTQQFLAHPGGKKLLMVNSEQAMCVELP